MDFEFIATGGNRPIPVCLVAHELRSGRRFHLWPDQFGPAPPYATGPDVLFVAYYASAELGCYRVLGWPMPERILDLFIEFRARTNGLDTQAGNSLLGALTYFGLDGIGAAEKDDMRALILRGPPWTGEERTAIVRYCEGDVEALERLLCAMLPKVDLPRALLRGRYMAAAAAMEHVGTPIDVPMLELFREHWSDIQDQLIAEIDTAYGVYDGRTFKAEWFAAWLVANNIPWPLRESGNLDLSDDTFRQMARVYPAVSPLRELRSSLSDLRLNDLAVGADGRNRTILSAYRSRTGRNQPSNTRYIFGPSVWLRGLIKPPPGHAVAYIDWSQQEIGIAAALSGDPASGSVSVWRLLSRLRQAGQRRPAGRYQGDARQPAGIVQAVHVGGPIRHGSAVTGAADRPTADRRAGSATCSPPDIPPFLGVVGRRPRSGHAFGRALYRVRLAGSRGGAGQSAFAAQFPYAGQRRRNAADRVQPGH